MEPEREPSLPQETSVQLQHFVGQWNAFESAMSQTSAAIAQQERTLAAQSLELEGIHRCEAVSIWSPIDQIDVILFAQDVAHA